MVGLDHSRLGYSTCSLRSSAEMAGTPSGETSAPSLLGALADLFDLVENDPFAPGNGMGRVFSSSSLTCGGFFVLPALSAFLAFEKRAGLALVLRAWKHVLQTAGPFLPWGVP